MQVVTMAKKEIVGITVRTENKIEMTNNGKIPVLWDKFKSSLIKNNISNVIPIGVYWNYEDDVNAAFNVTAGIELKNSAPIKEFNENVNIQPDQYLKFNKKGTMPDAVIKLWQKI